MKLFTDIKIGKRLAIGFGITIALMGLIVVVGIFSLGSINDQLERIVSVNNTKVRCANDMRIAFADLTYLIGEIVTAQDRKSKQEAKKKVDEAREKYKKSMDQLEALEINKEGKDLIAKLKEEVAKGKEANNSAIEVGMTGTTQEAAEKYGSLTKVIEGYMGASEAIVKYNEGRTQFRYEEMKKSYATTRIVFILLGILTIAIGVFLSLTITKSITTPVIRSASHIDLMAKGDFSIPVSEHALQRKDEMGLFARSLQTMSSSLRQILSEMMSSATNMASASTQLSTSAERLSEGAASQVEMATQVATASTQMNQATEDIARNSNKISESAGETVRIAKKGQEIVYNAIQEVNVIAETVEATSEFVKVLGEQSQKIEAIVITIDEIADQTNLLALNAAIEAARAGEHGRGFAVVADEVKKLAERTAASTTEIADMINSIRDGVGKTINSMNQAKRNVESGVEYSSQAQTALQDIIASIDTLYGGIQQTAAAIEEMSATTDEITRDMNKISDVTKEARTSSEEISGAAIGLSELAKRLEGTVQAFKV